ncbi:MAG: NnrS family protein [Magnetococcales bacterium]|nr:NnrS family protein [Magnetococcales bacterium]
MKLFPRLAGGTEPMTPLGILLLQGFRIFFTLAGIWSVTAMAAWLAFLAGWIPLHSPWSVIQLHGHEMLFGFTSAAAAGFLLSATPVWSKTPPLTGLPLNALVIAWLLGRGAALLGCCLPPWVQAVADVGFFAGFLYFLTPTLWFTGNRVHRIFPVLVALMAVGDLLTHLEALAWTRESARTGVMLGVNAIVFFLAMTGGHIMPMFTRDALKARGEDPSFAISPPLEIAGAVTLTLVVLADLFWPVENGAGWIFLAAGSVQGVRLARWHGHKTLGTPLLWVLHLGYLWLVAGLLLRGVARLTGLLNDTTAVHALTVGAMGLFTLGIMARIALAHTGRPLNNPSRVLTGAFLIMTGAALARVFWVSGAPETGIWLAGGLWIVAYLLFCRIILPILSAPRPDGQAG